ncbi:hypothetical protein DVH05_015317 [Phytophthora capsici]|nr:hypothetical protein DVH05_015317 [Phytophthora capsici]
MRSQPPSTLIPERSVVRDVALSSLTGSANLVSSPVSSRANSIVDALADSLRAVPASLHVVADVNPSINISASHVNGREIGEEKENKVARNTQEKDEASEQVNKDPPANEERKLMNSDSPADLGVVQSLSVSANDEVEQELTSLTDDYEEEDGRVKAPSHPVAKTDLAAVINRFNAVDAMPSDSYSLGVWMKGQDIYTNWANGDERRCMYQWLDKDYENPGFRHKYVSRLYQRRYSIITNVLSSDEFKFEPSSNTTIVSIGSGPGAELIAIYDHFQQRKDLRFLATDRVEGWREYIAAINNDQFTFEYMDLNYFDMMADLKGKSVSCVIISHVQLDFGSRDMVVRLFGELHPSLRCVIVLDRFPIQFEMPETPNGVSVTLLSDEKYGNDTVLIFTKDDETSSSSLSLWALSFSSYDEADEVEAMNSAMQDMDLSDKKCQGWSWVV